MSNTKVRGLSKFKGFKPGNVIKVTLSNGDIYKGLYAGTIQYDPTYRGTQKSKIGQYVVVYNSNTREAQVIDIKDRCTHRKSDVKDVSATCLTKTLSDYLRVRLKDYTQQQNAFHKLWGKNNKNKSDEELHRQLAQDAPTINPTQKVYNDLELLKNKGLDIRTQYVESSDTINFMHIYWGKRINGQDLGFTLFRESDGGFYYEENPSTQQVEAHLNKTLKKVKQSHYTQLVNKYKDCVDFVGPGLGADIDYDNTKYFTTILDFRIKVTKPTKLSGSTYDQFIKDLAQFIKLMTDY